MGSGVVVIVGWRRGARLAENRRLLERAALAGRLHPKGWREAARRWRSLTVRADGTLELATCTAQAAARRETAPARRAPRRKDRAA